MNTTEWDRLTVQVRMMVSILASIHGMLGLVVIWGGPERFPLPTYGPLFDVVGGNTWIYGICLLLAGGLMAIHKLPFVIIGLGLGWGVMALWTGLFGYAVAKFPSAGATAWVAYAGYAFLNALFGVKIWLYRREFRNRR